MTSIFNGGTVEKILVLTYKETHYFMDDLEAVKFNTILSTYVSSRVYENEWSNVSSCVDEDEWLVSSVGVTRHIEQTFKFIPRK